MHPRKLLSRSAHASRPRPLPPPPTDLWREEELAGPIGLKLLPTTQVKVLIRASPVIPTPQKLRCHLCRRLRRLCRRLGSLDCPCVLRRLEHRRRPRERRLECNARCRVCRRLRGERIGGAIATASVSFGIAVRRRV